MNFRDLRRVYQKLVFAGWRQQWRGGRLFLEFDYQLVTNEAERLAMHQELIADADDGVISNETADWLDQLTTKTFTHRLELGLKTGSLTQNDDLAGVIFQIGVVEAINYWKLACPAVIELACGQLTTEMQSFWQKLVYKGLGEFIYVNQLHRPEVAGLELTADNIVKFTTTSSTIYPKITVAGTGNLIPVGGGKDSAVTLEILRDQVADNLPLVMSAPVASYDCISVAGYTNYAEIKRQLDPQILALNQAGFLNGHVPFSAILAFISLLTAVVTGKRYIVLSNENSANEPSVPGTDFNHQYSKSWEFEADFQDYIAKFVVEGVEYFSLLRPLEELQIAELFSHYPAYHQLFRSCNVGKKTNSWCGHCPKCLFVFIMMAGFVDYDRVVAMFGKDLLADEQLLPILRQLLGLEQTKPFECVGTVSEVRRAMRLIVERHYSAAGAIADHQAATMPILLQKFVEYDLEAIELTHDQHHAVPAELLAKLHKECAKYGI